MRASILAAVNVKKLAAADQRVGDQRSLTERKKIGLGLGLLLGAAAVERL